MYRLWPSRAEKKGLPPGSAVYVGEKKIDRIKISIIDYNQETYDRRYCENAEQCARYIDKKQTVWINVDGLHEVETIQALSGLCNLHSLTIEDILNTGQRPKLEIFDEYIYLVLKMPEYDELSGMLDIYLSSTGNRLNEIMKILTIYAAIFIPLTFIAGVYGMNFNPEASPLNMPELRWYYGYPAALGLMAAVAAALLIFFKRRKWL